MASGTDSANQKGPRDWGAVAVAISVAALIVSIVGVVVSHQQYRQAAESFRQAAEQFEESGPRLEITKADALIFDSNSASWKDGPIPSKHVLSYAEMTPPNRPFLILSIVNSGRSTAAAKSVGVLVGEGNMSFASESFCTANDKLETCHFPITLDPAKEVEIYLPLDKIPLEEITCNEFIRTNGLIVAVKSTVGDTSTYSTGISEAWASYCSSLPTTTPGP